jgi:hypothetical protein
MPQPEPKRPVPSGFASYPIEGMPMLVPEAHQYGGTWVFYVIAPLILCGVVACLWLIVKGAIVVFGPTPRGERLSTIPSTIGSSSRTGTCETPLPYIEGRDAARRGGRSATSVESRMGGER